MSSGSTFKRCGCTDPVTGKALGKDCPKLRQRGHGSWTYAIDLPPGEGGRRRYRRKGGFDTQRDAQAALDELRARVRIDDEYDPTSTLTVAAWLDHWLSEKAKDTGSSAAGKKVRRSTARSYQIHIERYLKPALGHLPLDRLRAGHISAMFDEIEAANSGKARATGPVTRQRIFATLRAALNEAERQRKVQTNPCRHVQLASAPKARPLVWTAQRVADWQIEVEATRAAAVEAGRPLATVRVPPPSPVMVWTAEQTGAFLDAVAEDRLYPLWHLLTLRALRRGEGVRVGVVRARPRRHAGAADGVEAASADRLGGRRGRPEVPRRRARRVARRRHRRGAQGVA